MDDRYSLRPRSPPRSSGHAAGRGARADADELQVVLPDAVGSALRDGLREEAAPISRRLAEVKGLSNQTIRRLERLETDLESERHARVDDLALLVDLITGQLAGDERAARPDRARARAARRSRRAAPRPTAGRPLPTALARAAGAGSTSSNREPAPDLRLELDPAAERAESSRAIVRPRPVPPAASETNGRNSRSRCSGGMPGPVSSTDTLIVPFSCASSSAIRPPSGVARNAFESRLSTICSTRSPSETITGRSLHLDAVVDRAAPRLLAERLVRLLDELLHVDLLAQ